ncbi:MAG: SRPBCC family protein [Oligoflexia bacterium]|nr:SRPBCC family protein [Oligoflexia bacterium]
MAQASVSEVFNASVKACFQAVSDYSNYPSFLSDVKRISVIDSSPDKKLIEYELQIIKSFRYQLWTFEKPFSEISWKFHSGDLFKENQGKWTFKDLGEGRTQVDYNITAKFTLFVPGMIEKKLIEVNLPTMMKAFKQKAEAQKD